MEIMAMILTLEQNSTQNNTNSSPQNVSVLCKKNHDIYGDTMWQERHTLTYFMSTNWTDYDDSPHKSQNFP